MTEKPQVPERAAERLVMDYPVETAPRKSTKTVKGPKGKVPDRHPGAPAPE